MKCFSNAILFSMVILWIVALTSLTISIVCITSDHTSELSTKLLEKQKNLTRF